MKFSSSFSTVHMLSVICMIVSIISCNGYIFPGFTTVVRKTFTDAQKYCQDNYNTTLVVIHSNDTFNELLQEISETDGSTESFWIGLANKGNGSNVFDYQWVDGSILDYGNNISGGVYPWSNYLNPGSPNNINENCVRLWNIAGHRWADVPCTAKYFMICEDRITSTSTYTLIPTTYTPTTRIPTTYLTTSTSTSTETLTVIPTINPSVKPTNVPTTLTPSFSPTTMTPTDYPSIEPTTSTSTGTTTITGISTSNQSINPITNVPTTLIPSITPTYYPSIEPTTSTPTFQIKIPSENTTVSFQKTTESEKEGRVDDITTEYIIIPNDNDNINESVDAYDRFWMSMYVVISIIGFYVIVLIILIIIKYKRYKNDNIIEERSVYNMNNINNISVRNQLRIPKMKAFVPTDDSISNISNNSVKIYHNINREESYQNSMNEGGGKGIIINNQNLNIIQIIKQQSDENNVNNIDKDDDKSDINDTANINFDEDDNDSNKNEEILVYNDKLDESVVSDIINNVDQQIIDFGQIISPNNYSKISMDFEDDSDDSDDDIIGDIVTLK